jgi:hypothetical protein
MYGLPQAGIIANNKWQKHLAPYGYHPTAHTPGLWKHQQDPFYFSLVIDNFLIKYQDKTHANKLIQALKQEYKITTNWEATLYCGNTLKWDYLARTCELSISGYVKAALKRFQHELPACPAPVDKAHIWHHGTTCYTRGHHCQIGSTCDQ